VKWKRKAGRRKENESEAYCAAADRLFFGAKETRQKFAGTSESFTASLTRNRIRALVAGQLPSVQRENGGSLKAENTRISETPLITYNDCCKYAYSGSDWELIEFCHATNQIRIRSRHDCQKCLLAHNFKYYSETAMAGNI
jgi:hypothetical protein